MTYITTNYNDFLKHKLHEEINNYEQQLEQMKPVTTDKPKQSFITNCKEEFEKIMKQYDDL